MLKWFSKKDKSFSHFDLSVLRTDIHSHFIPGIDDGSPDMDTSISLLTKMQKLGYEKVITTPHVMSDCYKNNTEIILKGLDDLRIELCKQKINIEIDVAAEYYIDFDFEQNIENKNFLTFGNNYILIELSFVQPPSNLFDIIFRLQLQGYKVVLAHPERYGYYTKRDYEELVQRGVFLQINLLSLIGYYSIPIKKKSKELIRNNMISFIGTDCHNMHQAELYETCKEQEEFQMLVSSGTLLNSTL